MIVHAVKEGDRYYIPQAELLTEEKEVTLMIEKVFSQSSEMNKKPLLVTSTPDGTRLPQWLIEIHELTRGLGSDFDEEKLKEAYWRERAREEGFI